MPPPVEPPRKKKPPIGTPSIEGLGGKAEKALETEKAPESFPATEVASPTPSAAETIAGHDATESSAPLKRQKTEGADTQWPPV